MTLTIDSLPTELIQRMAAFSSCETVLALLKVNRTLHVACYHYSVFKTIVENGKSQQVQDPWDLAFLACNTSASDWARFALADERAWRWLRNHRELFLGFDLESYERFRTLEEFTYRKIVRWAPQLAALHHPFFAEIDLLVLGDQLLHASVKHAEDVKSIEFCVQAAVCRRRLSAMRNSDDGRTSREICREVYCVQNHLGMRGRSETPSQITLFHACSDCSLADYSRALTRPIRPPSRIPFQSFMNLRVPFSTATINDFESSYLQTVTSSSFLEDGEWVGYYTVAATPLSPARFDTPLHGIKFFTNPDPNAVKIKATGMDSHGDFELTGLISFNGKVELMKRASYYNYPHQDQGWHGQMTPFGIVGHWARVPSARGGELWLLKKEWLDEPLV